MNRYILWVDSNDGVLGRLTINLVTKREHRIYTWEGAQEHRTSLVGA